MSKLFALILDRWRLCALASSALMLAIAHGFETFGGLSPCTLCLRQREVYWTAAAVALTGLLIERLPPGRRWRGAFDALLAVIFLAGVGLAAYHAGAEWKFWPGPTACSSSGGAVNAQAMTDLLHGAKLRPPACDQAPWVFLGLSMAGWNALVLLKLSAFSLLALRHDRRTR